MAGDLVHDILPRLNLLLVCYKMDTASLAIWYFKFYTILKIKKRRVSSRPF